MHGGWLAAILNLLEMGGGGTPEPPFVFDPVCPLAVPLYARTELAAPLFARTDLPVPLYARTNPAVALFARSELPVPLYARDPLEVPMPGCRNEV